MADADAQQEAERVLLARYAPAGVLVNAHMDILQFRGHTGPYLEPPPGKATLNLLKMLRGGLLVTVRTAIEKAKNHNEPVHKENVEVRQHGGTCIVNVAVVPLKRSPAPSQQFWVLFEPVKEQAESAPDAPIEVAGKTVHRRGADESSRDRCAPQRRSRPGGIQAK